MYSISFQKFMKGVAITYLVSGLVWYFLPAHIAPLMFTKHYHHWFKDEIVQTMGQTQGVSLLICSILAWAASNAENLTAQRSILRAVILSTMLVIFSHVHGAFSKETVTLNGFMFPTLINSCVMIGGFVTSQRLHPAPEEAAKTVKHRRGSR